MLERDQRLALAGGAGGQDEFARPERQRAGAGNAREHRDVEDADGDDGVDGARAEDRGDHDRREQRRKGKDEIVEAHQRLVDKAAARRGPAAERNAEPHADPDRDQRHGDRIARADHDHRQHVAAEMVGAEPVRGRRRLHAVGDDQLGHVVGRPEERQQRHGRDQGGDDEAGDEGAVREGLCEKAVGGFGRLRGAARSSAGPQSRIDERIGEVDQRG